MPLVLKSHIYSFEIDAAMIGIKEEEKQRFIDCFAYNSHMHLVSNDSP